MKKEKKKQRLRGTDSYYSTVMMGSEIRTSFIAAKQDNERACSRSLLDDFRICILRGDSHLRERSDTTQNVAKNRE
jgi:hypothetical protein